MSRPTPPERLWQRLKHAGVGTRAVIGELIRSGAVLVDGRPASALTIVNGDSAITLDGEPIAAPSPPRTFLLNKPEGIDCCIEPREPDSIARILQHLPPGLSPVGRLDKDSCGLLLLTHDGKLCHRLMHPDCGHEKEYAVTVDADPSAEQLERLRSGAGYQVGPHRYQPRPCEVVQTAPRRFRITLTQGMHRQIRYMCKAAGLRVVRLERIRLNRLLLGDLAPGEARELTPAEVELLDRLPDSCHGSANLPLDRSETCVDS